VKSARGVGQGYSLSPNLFIFYKKYLTKEALRGFFFYQGATAPSGPRPPHCRGFVFTLRHTTLGRTPLEERSSPTQRLLPDNTQHTQETNIHAPGGIRTHSPSKRAAADPRFEGFGDFEIGGQVMCTVTYADDLVLLADEETVIQVMIDRIIEIGRYYVRNMNMEMPLQ